MTALLSVLTLWMLARIRFPDRPVTPNPVPPLLNQLTDASSFADLASAVDDLRQRLAPSLVALVPVSTDTAVATARVAERLPALRIRDDLAVAIFEPHAGGKRPLGVIAEDHATGLAIIRTDPTRAPVPASWLPQRLDKPRYIAVSSPSLEDVSLRPAFIGSLTPMETPAWAGPLWALPKDADIAPGAFLFTEDAELVGVVTRYDGGLAVVPGKTLLAAADVLLAQPPAVPVDLGIDVQALTPRLSIASGADMGVVVAWVDSAGAAAGALEAGDVIRAVDRANIRTPEEWRVRMARLVAGDTIALSVLQRGAQRDVRLMAAAPSDRSPSLGLMMRPIARVGIEVTGVDRGSAADVAGVEPGDVMTAIGGIAAPTASQVRSAFAAARRGDLLIVALTRGGAHRVVPLER